MRIWPEVGGSAPEMMLTSVDLPAPLSPTSPTTSPVCSDRSTPRSACTLPYRLVTWRTSTRGGSVAAAAALDPAGAGDLSVPAASFSLSICLSSSRVTWLETLSENVSRRDRTTSTGCRQGGTGTAFRRVPGRARTKHGLVASPERFNATVHRGASRSARHTGALLDIRHI